MHETPEDLAALQALIDRSYAGAGRHLLRIHTPERRLNAEQVCERLTGMCLLALRPALWAGVGDGLPGRRAVYARIEAERMFAFAFEG